ncbi:MAG TPA: hypothetical protein VFC73_04870 [Syntrophomonadaceae bacterium]|nr:hypothetical protein [Syntrophomonadaceae bacterium]
MKSTNGIELITASLDYPELNMVKYDGINSIITFEIALISEKVDEQKLFERELNKCLNTYDKLRGVEPITRYIKTKSIRGLCLISFHRDIETVNREELKLFIKLANSFLSEFLIKNDLNYPDAINNKQLKRSLLDQIYKGSKTKSSYLVYRQNGRVIFHNR